MNSKLSRQLYGIMQRWSGSDIEKYLCELNKSQWLSRDEIRAQQWEKLSALIQHAFRNIPYYSKTWKGAGIHPLDIRSWADFKKIPFLTKEQVQENYNELQFEGMKNVPLYYGHSSGSTGRPLNFVRTQESKARFFAAQYRGYGWYGIYPGDKQGRLYGVLFDQANSFKEKIKNRIMNRRYISVFDLTDDRLKTFAKRMNRFFPVYLNGYASWHLRFAEFMQREKKLSYYPWIPLKAVVSTSEVLPKSDQALIEEVFECPVINEYGASEIGLVAISCEKGSFHIVQENVYFETIPVINDDLEQNSNSETLFESVVTDLYNYAMPFIRYRVRDMLHSALDDNEFCECGRESQVIGPIIGRTNSYVITPEGKVLGGLFFKRLADSSLERGGGIKRFMVRQDDINRIVFYIVKDQDFSDKTLKFLLDTTRTHLGPLIAIDVEYVDELPRTTTGKLMNFSSSLNIEKELAKIREKR